MDITHPVSSLIIIAVGSVGVTVSIFMGIMKNKIKAFLFGGNQQN